MLLQFAVTAMGVAVASMAVAMSKLFGPFRAAVGKRSKWLGMLFSCPYCFSHWVAFGAVLLLDYRFPFWSYWPSTFLTTFALTVCCAPFSWVLYRCYAEMAVD